jgi:hypothetical protein
MIYLQQLRHVPFQKEEISIWFQKEVFVTLDVIMALKKGIQLSELTVLSSLGLNKVVRLRWVMMMSDECSNVYCTSVSTYYF